MKSMGAESKGIVSTIHVEGKKISKVKLRHIWHELYPREPLPRIEALIVSKEMFVNHRNQIIDYHKKLGRPNFVDKCSIREHGEVVIGSASVVKTGDCYLILVRSDSLEPREDLKHEIRHIHDGDADKY